MFAIAVLLPGMGAVSAQSYPNKPIRIVTSEPGGGSDFTTRVVAQGLTSSLGHQVIVDNRAGTLAAAQIMTKAAGIRAE